MSHWHVGVAAAIFTVCQIASAGPARTVVVGESDVPEIRTALGLSTILELPARPTTPPILGDQDAFKIEAAGSGLAIKPLLPGAKSNLFTFTDYDRFSFRLVTVPQAQADYRVIIKKKADQGYAIEPANSLRIKTLSKKKRCGGYTLVLKRAAIPFSEKIRDRGFFASRARVDYPTRRF